MGQKLQRTLKLDISFSLEHFSISLAIFTQIASAPLIYGQDKLDRICQDISYS